MRSKKKCFWNLLTFRSWQASQFSGWIIFPPFVFPLVLMEYALSKISANWLDSWVKQVMTVSVIPLLGPISTIEVEIVWRQNLKSFRRLKIPPSFIPLSWTMSWVIPEKYILIYKRLEIRGSRNEGTSSLSKVSWPAWHLTNAMYRVGNKS